MMMNTEKAHCVEVNAIFSGFCADRCQVAGFSRSKTHTNTQKYLLSVHTAA
jgi:hypothetical protein